MDIFDLHRNDIPGALDVLREHPQASPEEWHMLLRLQDDGGDALLDRARREGLLPERPAR